MKIVFYFTAIIVFASSCAGPDNKNISGTVNDKLIILKNANTTISVDDKIQFGIIFKEDGKKYFLTDHDKKSRSVCLFDTVNREISFKRKKAELNEINDKFGTGKLINKQ